MSPTLAHVVAALFVFALIAATARSLWRLRHDTGSQRSHSWRVLVLLTAQLASAVLLYLVLFPPDVPGEAGTMLVLTANADAARSDNTLHADHRVALPEAPFSTLTLADVERLPDLATALRRYPGTRHLHVVGAGLTARDREAVAGLTLDFQPSPLPHGLIALQSPSHVQAGRQFKVGGRVEHLSGGSVELRDPGNAVVDRSAIDVSGGFGLRAIARNAGLASWRLQLRDKAGRMVETTLIPVDVRPGTDLHVRMMAGAPNAELKYLRRWAVDARLHVETRISLGGGMAIGNTSPALDATGLRNLDLLVLDQRSWQSLSTAQRSVLDMAVAEGLGLLLQLPDTLSASDRSQLRRLGFLATNGNSPRSARLSAAINPVQQKDDSAEKLPFLTLAPFRLDAADGTPLLRDAEDISLGAWRAHGLGRIGVAVFEDSYQLALAGYPDVHGELWSGLFSQLARARPVAHAAVDAMAWVDQRSTFCDLQAGAVILAPNGHRVPLQIDPATTPHRCAGFWPSQPGWHVLDNGQSRTPFHVRAAADAPGLRSMALREATQALVSAAPAGTASVQPLPLPGPRWPWFVGWLLLSAALWWLERSRLGIVRADAPISGT